MPSRSHPPAPGDEARPATPEAHDEDYDDFDDRETVVSVFGSARRAGPWAPAEQTRAIAGFSNVVLDFTEADLPPGLTEVDAHAVFGNVVLRVPASLQVELSALALVGNVVHRSGRVSSGKRLRRWLRLRPGSPRTPPADDEAIVSVRGIAFFGSIIVEIA